MFPRARSFLCTILAPSNFNQTPVRPGLLAIAMNGRRSLSSKPNAPSLQVQHDAECEEFRIEFPDDSRAFLKYEKEGDLIKIMHTEVPKEMGGRGLGKILAKAALSHIEDHKYRAEVYCDYVQHYIENYEPKYLKYVEN